jgi:hypothetical protein
MNDLIAGAFVRSAAAGSSSCGEVVPSRRGLEPKLVRVDMGDLRGLRQPVEVAQLSLRG